MESDAAAEMTDRQPDGPWAGQTPEQHYEATTSAAARKRRGQFFTPPAVAAEMVRWACPAGLAGDFLDPAVGAGIFIRQALTLEPARQLSCYGYDIDADVLSLADVTLVPSGRPVHLSCGDFLTATPGRTFDAIVCNPPYIKHHDIPNKSAVFEQLRKTGLELPQTTNYYCLFLLRACQLLGQGGRCAFIVPSEFLNADYGIAVKRHLLASGLLRGIIQFDFNTQVFDGILTTACILLLEKSAAAPSVRLASLHDPQQLAALFANWEPAAPNENHAAWREWPADALDPAKKWRNYFQDQDQDHPGTGGLISLSDLARCMRGIATGCNDYFTLTQQEIASHRLPLSSVRRCITRARDGASLVFDDARFDALAKQQRKVYLIEFGEQPGASEQAYLAQGEALGVPQRFLPRHRRIWHMPEHRAAADIWVQVFSRGRVRFILNEAGVLNLTCFHGLYLTPAGQPYRLPLWLYLNTSIGQELMRQERREYGGGLEKFEPRDIERLPVPDFARWPAGDLQRLERLAGQFLDATRTGGEGLSILAQANQLINKHLDGARLR